MKSVSSIFGRPNRQIPVLVQRDWTLNKCLMGVEIEVESLDGVVIPENSVPGWNRKTDGSLRNGYEFVLQSPMAGNDLATAVRAVFERSNFKRSMTGSTHIHMDMMEEEVTPSVVQTIVLMLFVLEPAIFAIADPGREWCGYTNKLVSAPPVLLSAVMNMNDDNVADFLSLCRGEMPVGRYYGLNLMALSKFGSLEFRYFPTATSEDELVDWVNLVQSFKLAAMRIGNINELIKILTNRDLYMQFLDDYFPKWKDTFLHEVPERAAQAASYKALALATTYHIEPESYDANVILNSKMLRKFAKVPKAATEIAAKEMHIYNGSQQIIPEGSSVPEGTVICCEGMFHWAPVLGQSWRYFELGDLDRYSHSVLQEVLSYFQEPLNSFSSRLAAANITTGSRRASECRFEETVSTLSTSGLVSLYTIISPMVDKSRVKFKVRTPTNTYSVDNTSAFIVEARAHANVLEQTRRAMQGPPIAHPPTLYSSWVAEEEEADTEYNNHDNYDADGDEP